MSEELKEASDIKKLIGKNKGEEDPILVAQRFLNIFRQLHIFDSQRREEFNNLILDLPVEIRGMFGTLPGGSMLQEYVDELEINAGAARSSPDVSAAKKVPEASPLSQIKSAAPQGKPIEGGVVMAGEAKIVADANFAKILADALNSDKDIKRIEMQDLISAVKSSAAGKGGTIVPDEQFAKAMAQAFAQALQLSDANKKADTAKLIDAVKEPKKIVWPEGLGTLGKEFSNTLKSLEEFLKTANNNRKEEIKQIVSAVKSSGSTATGATMGIDEGFAETLAKSLAQALGEHASNKSDDIKELIEVLRQNKGMDYEALSQALVKGLRPILPNPQAPLSYVPMESDVAPATNKQTSYKNSANDNFVEAVAAAVEKAIEASEKSRLEQTKILISSFQDIMSSKAAGGGNAAIVQTAPANEELIAKITSEFTQSINELRKARENEQKEIAIAINAINKTLNEKGFGAGLNLEAVAGVIAKAQSEKSQEVSKKQAADIWDNLSEAPKEGSRVSIFADAVKSANVPVPEEISEDDTEETDENENAGSADLSKGPFEVLVEKKKKKKKKKKKFEEQSPNSDFVPGTKPLPMDVIKKKEEVGKYIKSAFEPAPIEETKASKSDWGFGDDEPLTDWNIDEDPSLVATDTLDVFDDDWGMTTEETKAAELPLAAADNGVEGQDWEWEYEEDELAAEGANGVEGEDWEWEYEEEDDSLAMDDANGVEGQDWEWEYEEEASDDEADADGENAVEAVLAEDVSESEEPEVKQVEMMYGPQIVISELRDAAENSDPYLANDNIGV